MRRQLTLFVNSKDAEIIELVRREFNPIQFELINSHVTLCREDEIENLEQVILNLLSLACEEITIDFGKAIRFDSGKGVLLPAKGDNAEFLSLRRQVLFGLYADPRKQEPHITLMHPRNSTCTDRIFQEIKKLNLPSKLIFNKISLIEQEDGGKWKILKVFDLK